MSAPGADRLWEVDVARSLAIAMMVAYHAAYDVDLLAPSVPIDAFGGAWRALQVATGSTFLFVVGVSLAISNGRARARGARGLALWRRHARRALQVLGAALLVTLVTFALLGDDGIRFGILHCIGASMLIAAPLVPLGWSNAVLGIAAIVAGLALADGPGSDVPGAFILGFRPDGELGVDYYPLLPWIGPVLLGLAAGRALYPEGRRGRWGRILPPAGRAARLAGAPGRHALPIYLAHQPVLIPLVAAALALAGVEVSLSGVG